MALGLYISVPFCRSKCSYCNFASGVFPRAVFTAYVDRVCREISQAELTAVQMGAESERLADSIYLGGGTPTLLETADLERIFAALRGSFSLASDAEITVECAPGTLPPEALEMLVGCGVNRVSLGVQSFVDQETAAVGRLHKRATVLDDIRRLREAGICNINVDLIAGLPHQTQASWEASLVDTLACGAPHVSVYMLEVDDESRLGRELIAGGTRYHAHLAPDEDATADFYLRACQRLNAAGVRQYEISNFAREPRQSRHNLKYWTRQPYVGFGVDAHSMLRPRAGYAGAASAGNLEAVRFSTADELQPYLAGAPLKRTAVTPQGALEEEFFLGLRLSCGVDLKLVAARYGEASVPRHSIDELASLGLLEREDSRIRLTDRGRLLSNEVFQRFLLSGSPTSPVSEK